ncbi:hypothetical protein C356_00346 [Cryptococcus neoformans c45]|nr:hypothetical protein C356_00346 [Cryptococcus neoformans var. grubii c45]
MDEGTSEGRQLQSRSIHGDNDNDDLREEGNPCHEEDGGNLSSRHPLLEKSIRRRLGHPRRPHGQPASEMSEEGRKVFEEDVKLRREAAQRDRDREVREMARAEREDEHWAREAVYFEKQNDLSEAQKCITRGKQKMRRQKPLQGSHLTASTSVANHVLNRCLSWLDKISENATKKTPATHSGMFKAVVMSTGGIVSRESRGALGGAVDFAAIRQEIEELPDRPGTTRELIEMIERGMGEDDNETSEVMDIDPQSNGQQTEEADDDCIGDDEEELMVLGDEVSDGDDLADAIEMVSLSHV